MLSKTNVLYEEDGGICAWCKNMNYLNLAFYVFFPIFLILYNAFPQKLRYIVIFIGSYIFYGYANMEMLLTLFVITLFSYIGGLAIERKKAG